MAYHLGYKDEVKGTGVFRNFELKREDDVNSPNNNNDAADDKKETTIDEGTKK